MGSRRVADYMNRKLVTLRPDMTIREAEQLFAEHEIGGAPVVDEKGQLVGVLSQRDLVRLDAQPVPAAEAGAFFTTMEEFQDLAQVPIEHHNMPVEDAMTREVLTVTPDTDVWDAARLLREHRIHRLLVVEDSRLVGILSALDLLGALAPDAAPA